MDTNPKVPPALSIPCQRAPGSVSVGAPLSNFIFIVSRFFNRKKLGRFLFQTLMAFEQKGAPKKFVYAVTQRAPLFCADNLGDHIFADS
ncbi:MAG TPA: hypothetical protein VIH89_16925 [Candidatus Sulfotelmatobacter sp.]